MTPQKSRLIFLLELLNRETDEEHQITIAEIIAHLNAEGISANRHTVVGDLNTLIAHGVDVVCNKSRQNYYFIGVRHFELPELMLLVDAVQAARFIPAKQSNALITKLCALTSVHQSDKLNRQLYVDKQPKAVNQAVLYTVDMIHSAIHDKTQITFQYYEYTAAKRKSLKHNGQVYQFSPYALIWKNDSYYAVGYSEIHGKVVKFRVDRMANPRSTEAKATHKPKDFRIETYAKSVFQMFDDEIHTVTLRCENSLMKSVIDQFGEKVKTTIADDNHFTAEMEVSVSPTFYGWIVGFGGAMEIIAPDAVLEKYTRILKNILGKVYK